MPMPSAAPPRSGDCVSAPAPAHRATKAESAWRGAPKDTSPAVAFDLKLTDSAGLSPEAQALQEESQCCSNWAQPARGYRWAALEPDKLLADFSRFESWFTNHVSKSPADLSIAYASHLCRQSIRRVLFATFAVNEKVRRRHDEDGQDDGRG